MKSAKHHWLAPQQWRASQVWLLQSCQQDPAIGLGRDPIAAAKQKQAQSYPTGN